MRFGIFAAVPVAAVTTEPSDGTIASSIGSAIAAPTPRRKVRRWMCHLSLMTNLSYRLIGCVVVAGRGLIARRRRAASHLERHAVHDAHHQRRNLAVALSQLVHDCINRRLIERLDAAAEGERERVLSDGSEEIVLPRLRQQFGQFFRTAEL